MRKVLPAFLFILLSAALLCGQTTFENKKFGFSIQEPKDWIVVEKSEVVKNLEKFDLTEAGLANLIKNSRGSISMVVYVKYDAKLKSGLIPKIQIDVRAKTTKNFAQFKTAVNQNAIVFKRMFENFELIEPTREIEISKIKSATFTAKFTVKTQDGDELKIRSRVLAIPYKNYFFQVSMVDGQVDEDNSALFDEIIKTIKIGN